MICDSQGTRGSQPGRAGDRRHCPACRRARRARQAGHPGPAGSARRRDAGFERIDPLGPLDVFDPRAPRDPYRTIRGGDQDRRQSGGAGESEVIAVADRKIVRPGRAGQTSSGAAREGAGPAGSAAGTSSRRERMANTLDRYSLGLQLIQVFPIMGFAAASVVSVRWLGYLIAALVLLAATAWVVRVDRSGGPRAAARRRNLGRSSGQAERDPSGAPAAMRTGSATGAVARVESVSLIRPLDPLGRPGDEPAVPEACAPLVREDTLIQAEVVGENGNFTISIWLRAAPAIPPQLRRRPHPPHPPRPPQEQ
ncbi:MAG TPA: hypothetical protein VGX23_27055 [Actinocrinis sp.]|nr:hypothetical protein [Actinocrinis sp.]